MPLSDTLSGVFYFSVSVTCTQGTFGVNISLKRFLEPDVKHVFNPLK